MSFRKVVYETAVERSVACSSLCSMRVGWIQTFRASILTKFRESWIHTKDFKKIWISMITFFFYRHVLLFFYHKGKKKIILTFVRYWGKFRNVNVKDSSRNSVLWFWRRISEGRKIKVDGNNQKVVVTKIVDRTKPTFHDMRH